MTSTDHLLAIWSQLSPRAAVVAREPLPLAQRLEHDVFWSLPWVAASDLSQSATQMGDKP